MSCEKRIAYVFEQAKIFLTKDGNYYRYEEENGKYDCHKLTEKEKTLFVQDWVRGQGQEMLGTMIVWHPVAKGSQEADQLTRWQLQEKRQNS